MISPSQRPLPDNTQHSLHTNIQALGGIRTHDGIRRAAVDLRLRPRGHWDRLICMFWDIILCVVSIMMPNCWQGWAVYFLRFILTASFKSCTVTAVHTLCLHQKTLLKSSNTESFSFSSNFRTSLTLNFLNEHYDHWRMVSGYLPPALYFHVIKGF